LTTLENRDIIIVGNIRQKERTMEYRTPVGTFETWELAAEACEANDLDPTLCIEVVPLVGEDADDYWGQPDSDDDYWLNREPD
jgi:hypothetical protein